MTDRLPGADAARSDDEWVRDLLRSMPSPDRMPDVVTSRVAAALRAEQRARVADQPTDTTVRPVSRPAPATPAPRVRSSGGWLRPAAGLAAAAAVGALAVLGVQHAGQQPTTRALATLSPGDITGGVHVDKTGTSYTGADLKAQAARLVRTAGRNPVNSADVASLGLLTTKQGALACAESIGNGLVTPPDKVDVDIATYNGEPALIVILTKGGRATAWVLSRTCVKGAKPLAGPTAISL